MSTAVAKASRSGRYRKRLVDPKNLSPYAQALEAAFAHLDQQRLHGKMRDAEFVACGLLALLLCRRPDALQRHQVRHQTKKRNPAAEPVSESGFLLSELWKLLRTHTLPVPCDPDMLDSNLTVCGFLQQIRFRGIPDAARLALLEWLDNRYPLILLFHIPSAADVFELQKNGHRCITFLKKSEDLTAYHHERDAISFVVHDLIHAHEFYSIPRRARQQIGFYHWLDPIRSHPLLNALLVESDGFLKSWEYILSDMNSYCGHLLKTLEAAFVIHAGQDRGVLLWKRIVDDSDLHAGDKVLFHKINSDDWCDTDFLRLEFIFEERVTSGIHASIAKKDELILPPLKKGAAREASGGFAVSKVGGG